MNATTGRRTLALSGAALTAFAAALLSAASPASAGGAGGAGGVSAAGAPTLRCSTGDDTTRYTCRVDDRDGLGTVSWTYSEGTFSLPVAGCGRSAGFTVAHAGSKPTQVVVQDCKGRFQLIRL